MAPTAHVHILDPPQRNSVPRIDLSKAVQHTSAKKNRKSMNKLHSSSGHGKPLGLLSPPSSQTNVLLGEPDSRQNSDQISEYGVRERDEDAARLLISPPPEEELILSRRSSFNRSSTSHLQDNTNSTAPPSIALYPKRKRSMASTHPHVGSSPSVFHDDHTSFRTSATEAQTTPNPKPRKQSRKFNRAHVRTHSNGSDVSMEIITIRSPTRSTGGGTEIDREPLLDPSYLANEEIQATPSRKRRQPKLMRSPHVSNPNADYIPPSLVDSDNEPENNCPPWPYTKKAARLGRRSLTPALIPPYEPPNVVFTPPREVVVSPIASPTRSKQKRKVAKVKGLKLNIKIKSEPPDFAYLNEPMPPASPTDDPLLLSGPPEETGAPHSRTMRDASVSADLVENNIIRPASPHNGESLPPSSPPPPASSSPVQAIFNWPNDGVVHDDWSTDSMDSMQPYEHVEAEKAPQLGLDDFLIAPAESWSDNDDDVIPRTPTRKTDIIDEGIGEYTGHWRTAQIPTKADPPSSATRSRMEEWGRPKSPYPYSRPSSRASAFRAGSHSPSPPHSLSRPSRSAEEQAKSPYLHDHQTPPSSKPAEQQAGILPAARKTSTTLQDAEIQSDHDQEEEGQEEQEVRALSLPGDDEDDDSADEEEVRRLSIEPSEIGRENLHDPSRDRRSTLHAKLSSVVPASISDHVQHTPSTFNSPAPFRDLPFLSRTPDTRPRNARASALERAKELFGTRLSPEKQSLANSRFYSDEMEPEVSTTDPDQLTNTAVTVDEEELQVDLTEDVDEVSGDESDPINEDPGLVQITSSDPKAAARAAAILKQHDYDCFTKIVLKQQRTREKSSNDKLEQLKRDNRRKTLSSAGISKSKTRLTPRRSLGTVIGEFVYMPDSPVTTLGGLLEEAEREVQLEQSRCSTPHVPKSLSPENTLMDMELGGRPLFDTPLPAKYAVVPQQRSVLTPEGEHVEAGDQDLNHRTWSKEDWKLLDACFTDERIALASESPSNSHLSTFNDGEDEVPLVEVDLVNIDNVVERFVIELGGNEIVDRRGWSRESLRGRAKAIQKKQRSGRIAPPTTPYGSRESSVAMEVPNFTPLPRRPFPPARKPMLLPLAGSAAPFSNIPDDVVDDPRRRKIPATLLAPRYSHLLDEAVAISREIPTGEKLSDSSATHCDESSSILDTPTQHQQTGFRRLFSYLPNFLNSPAPTTRKASDSKPGLPLPPAEILDKPRGPIITPARAPAPKVKAPKELVNLHHQPAPEKKASSMIPRRIPQRLVKLNQIGLPEEREHVSRPKRRSSGGSVKDLILTFESYDDGRTPASGKVIQDWKKGISDGGKSNRPVWKP
ncbi:hypothetical protein C8R42DRAFT_683427 [Lentinula raphanica]|nr:hypothetical protein C8R42DRAFT_683427 [Lentinula raphanica]